VKEGLQVEVLDPLGVSVPLCDSDCVTLKVVVHDDDPV